MGMMKSNCGSSTNTLGREMKLSLPIPKADSILLLCNESQLQLTSWVLPLNKPHTVVLGKTGGETNSS